MFLLGLEGVGFSDLYVLGGQLSRRVLGKSGFSFWAGTLFYVGILSAHGDSHGTPVTKCICSDEHIIDQFLLSLLLLLH